MNNGILCGCSSHPLPLTLFRSFLLELCTTSTSRRLYNRRVTTLRLSQAPELPPELVFNWILRMHPYALPIPDVPKYGLHLFLITGMRFIESTLKYKSVLLRLSQARCTSPAENWCNVTDRASSSRTVEVKLCSEIRSTVRPSSIRGMCFEIFHRKQGLC